MVAFDATKRRDFALRHAPMDGAITRFDGAAHDIRHKRTRTRLGSDRRRAIAAIPLAHRPAAKRDARSLRHVGRDSIKYHRFKMTPLFPAMPFAHAAEAAFLEPIMPPFCAPKCINARPRISRRQ